MTFLKNISIAAALFLVAAFSPLSNNAGGQESSSTPTAAPTAPAATGPSAALRDVLVAACSQSQNNFVRFLTARNKESFNRMAPAARVAFMKRFVLLNEPGTAKVTANPAGRPIVLCETPAGAADIQLGGADIRDNVAFMPVSLRDATDTTNASDIQVTMGMVKENGEWKILSLGLVLLDLPSLELEWDSAEADKNEVAALDSIKAVAEAVEAYRRQYTRLPDSLSSLGPALHGPVSAQAAGLVDADIAAGLKNGYSFRFVIVGASTLGAPAKYELAATPISYGRTGHRSFFIDQNGILRGADRKGAVGSSSDPRLPQTDAPPSSN